MINKRNYKKRERINERINAEEIRLIDEKGENVGTVNTKVALSKAIDLGLDLVEISGKANPPIVKMVDYGKYKYDENKKNKGVPKKSAGSQVKNIQIKIGTSQDAITTRTGQINKWLDLGHRVRVDLFLFGRYKSMDENFLKNRLQNFLDLISSEYKALDEIKRSPKGFSITIQGKINPSSNKEKENKEKTKHEDK